MIECLVGIGILASAAHAEDKLKYKMTATATREAGDIKIALKLETEAFDAKGMRLTTEFSSPAIKIREGQEAVLAMNSPERGAGDQSKPAEDPMTTGVKISVFSVKGEDNVLVVGASLVKGVVLWDDAQRILIRSKP
jgi:hypothetical protein